MEEISPQQAALESQKASIIPEEEKPVSSNTTEQNPNPTTEDVSSEAKESEPKLVEEKDLKPVENVDPILEETKIEDKVEEMAMPKDEQENKDASEDHPDSKDTTASQDPKEVVEPKSEESEPKAAESQNNDTEAEPKIPVPDTESVAEVKAVKEDAEKANEPSTEEVSSSAPLPQSDHVKQPKGKAKKEKKDKSEMEADMSTLFILDLMKQRKEKQMRKKKDDLINDLAMKKKQQMMEARMGMRVMTRPAFGGFVGVNAILSGSNHASPATRRRTPKPRPVEPEVEIPPPERTDLLIMGIIRDKKEQAYHEAHQVMAEQAGVPSDDKWMAKFGD